MHDFGLDIKKQYESTNMISILTKNNVKFNLVIYSYKLQVKRFMTSRAAKATSNLVPSPIKRDIPYQVDRTDATTSSHEHAHLQAKNSGN